MVGIDIGTKNIKACSVGCSDGRTFVLRSAFITGSPVSSKGNRVSLTARKIREVLRRARVSDPVAASSLGDSQAVIRNFSFPSLSGAELENAVRFETEQSIFSDLNEMYSDYQPLPPAGGNKTEVLFVAVPKAAADERFEVLARAGLSLQSLDIDNLAVADAYAMLTPGALKETVAIADIGYTNTNLCVVDGGKVRFARTVGFGTAAIAGEMVKVYGISQETASDLLQHSALWNKTGVHIKSLLRKSAVDLIEAVYRSIEYCMNRKLFVNVDRMLLTGGGAEISGLDQFVSETIGMRTEKWNPFDHITAPQLRHKEYGCLFATAVGLALREHLYGAS